MQSATANDEARAARQVYCTLERRIELSMQQQQQHSQQLLQHSQQLQALSVPTTDAEHATMRATMQRNTAFVRLPLSRRPEPEPVRLPRP